MYTLYIDTHFVNLHLALFKDDNLIDEEILESNKHSEYTINLLEQLLVRNNINISDLNEIIVINGPGSFTGVRIGVVIAKIIGYSKNIKVKTLSYLEAMAINYDMDVIVGIKDRNGVFIGEFDKNHNLLNDYYYLSNIEFDNFKKPIVLETKIDLLKVLNFTKDKEAVNIHLLKPLYVKKIEVQKND